MGMISCRRTNRNREIIRAIHTDRMFVTVTVYNRPRQNFSESLILPEDFYDPMNGHLTGLAL